MDRYTGTYEWDKIKNELEEIILTEKPDNDIENSKKLLNDVEHILGNKFFEIEMYHDIYETRIGDGFYPLVEKQENYSPIIVAFKNIQNSRTWLQCITDNSTHNNINGLDGNNFNELLKKLNTEYIKNTDIKNFYNKSLKKYSFL
jgi:hypothetical protein